MEWISFIGFWFYCITWEDIALFFKQKETTDTV